MIEININGSVVSVQATEALYCGSQNVHTCSFAFDESWKRYSKSAVFRVGGRAMTAVIDEENSCLLPWELLVRENIGVNIEVGVYGVSAEGEILTSVWDSIGAVREGSELGNDAREPSAGVYEQVMASVQKVDDKIVSYSTEVQTLTQRAESAATVASNSAADAIEKANESAASAAASESAAVTAESAKNAIQTALDNIPAGSTLVINDLTTGGTSAALSAEMGKTLGQRPNTNLLHNWYFVNPINQRGQAEYGSAGYTVDRWYTAALVSVSTIGKLTVENGGIRLSGNGTAQDTFLRQKLENAAELVGKTVTMSVLVDEVDGTWSISQYGNTRTRTITSEGLFSLTFTWGSNTTGAIQLWNSGAANGTIKILAVKLELGDTQTLAHHDGNKWVLNEIPDYGEELRKCQRYFYRLKNDFNGAMYFNTAAKCLSANALTTVVDLPVPMRIAPAVTPSSVGALIYNDGTQIASTSVTRNGVIAGNQKVGITLGGAFTVGTVYMIYIAGGAYIDFSADL